MDPSGDGGGGLTATGLFCASCGAQSSPTAKFCGECGGWVRRGCPTGKGLLLDTTKFGYAAVRESLAMRVGYTNDDMTRNILRFVAEERLTLCVTRPSAVLSITNLP